MTRRPLAPADLAAAKAQGRAGRAVVPDELYGRAGRLLAPALASRRRDDCATSTTPDRPQP